MRCYERARWAVSRVKKDQASLDQASYKVNDGDLAEGFAAAQRVRVSEGVQTIGTVHLRVPDRGLEKCYC